MTREAELIDVRLTRMLIDAGMEGLSQPTILRKFPGRGEVILDLLSQLLENDKVQKFSVPIAGETKTTTIWRATVKILEEDRLPPPRVSHTTEEDDDPLSIPRDRLN